MRTFLAVVLVFPGFVAALHAADSPSEAEQALRARVTEFNQLRVEHKWRASEAFVAEDSKDFYYESKKPDLKAFKIEKIVFAPDYQSAIVTVHGKAEVSMPPIGIPLVTEGPYTDHWKLENGKWCWYLDKSTIVESPFGRSAPGVFGGSSSGASPPPDPTIARSLGTAAAMAAHGALQATPQQIALDASHPTPIVITVKNILPGPVTLKPVAQSAGLRVSIAKPNLGPTESTEVTVTPVEGSSERPAALVISALPLNQTISIPITWASAR